jgi:23S rRNA (pseudouridine1915-N3)-methyltransferase
MQVKVYCVGKVRNKNIFSEIGDLKRRIARFEIVELREVKDRNPDIVKRKEFELFESHIDSSCFNVLLTEDGEEFSTRGFYDKFALIGRTVNFFVCGAFGPCEEMRRRVDLQLSLSRMTFTHEQALYMLVEQVYRARCFEKNIPYSK